MEEKNNPIGLGLIPNSPTKTKGVIYRIMNFCRVVEIFEKKEIHFAHPSSWDDKYESRLVHPNSGKLFGQCWTNTPMSDAMWRIYSSDQLGVRISTTPMRLHNALKADSAHENSQMRIKDVIYLPVSLHTKALNEIKQDLRMKYDISRAADALYYKRDAFAHESECRAMIFCKDANDEAIKSGVKLKVEPNQFIKSILLDPRAPQPIVDAFKHYFITILNFKGTVSRSALYKTPNPIDLQDDDEP